MTNKVPEQRDEPPNLETEVLPGQDYLTSNRAVINEYGAMFQRSLQ
jgi:hypothetical protein